MDFGKKIIEVRNSKGLTQDEVAEKCNVTVRTIQRIESGTVKPRAFTMKIISEVLGFDFFETSNTGHDVDIKVENSNKKDLLFLIKDLFNLKTNAMKKISILATSSLIIGLAVFIFVSETKAQSSSGNEPISSVNAENNPYYVKTKERIEVVFTNKLTFDSLVNIKNDLKVRGIIINYTKIEFDNRNQLLSIDCEIDCKDGFKGSFGAVLLNSTNKNKRFGFYRDYSKNTKSPFGTGLLGD
jgi:transcriptional regulator with XRE-family HTH domain